MCWKEPDKVYMLHDSISTKFGKRQIYSDKADSGGQEQSLREVIDYKGAQGTDYTLKIGQFDCMWIIPHYTWLLKIYIIPKSKLKPEWDTITSPWK